MSRFNKATIERNWRQRTLFSLQSPIRKFARGPWTTRLSTWSTRSSGGSAQSDTAPRWLRYCCYSFQRPGLSSPHPSTSLRTLTRTPSTGAETNLWRSPMWRTRRPRACGRPLGTSTAQSSSALTWTHPSTTTRTAGVSATFRSRDFSEKVCLV